MEALGGGGNVLVESKCRILGGLITAARTASSGGTGCGCGSARRRRRLFARRSSGVA